MASLRTRITTSIIASTIALSGATLPAHATSQDVAPTDTTAASETITSDFTGETMDGNKKVGGAYISEDGEPIAWPQPANNPFNVKPGQTLKTSNFKYADSDLICKRGIVCSFQPIVKSTVTTVKDTKNGTVVTVDSFIGYKGHPVYNTDNQLIGVVDGSNGGNSRIHLFGTKEAAQAAAPKYKKLGSTGLLAPLSSDSGLSSSSKPAAGGVDAREDNYNDAAWTKTDTTYFESVSYNPTTRAFVLNPKKQYLAKTIFPAIFGLFGSTMIPGGGEAMWKEAVALGLPPTTSIKQQFVCHAQGSVIKKDDWKLELGKPAARSQAAQNWALCNPRLG